MSVAIVTGSSGLVGSESVRFLHLQGMDVIGIDNHMRGYFLGRDGGVQWNHEKLSTELPRFQLEAVDIRDQGAVDQVFQRYGRQVTLVIHCAAQPSHEWAAREPFTDFSVNAHGTMVMLEALRQHCPEATFIYTSTNKVYGDKPNDLPLVETATRWELDKSHPYFAHGVDERMGIDQSMHSLYGVSKLSADVMTQEYGRYFGLKTGVFRGGCLTGPAHSGAELHGFLSYLIRCVVTGKPYTVFGYKGKQVRDNIHSSDLVRAFWEFHKAPRSGEVYNIGGSRHSHCSLLEAIAMAESASGKAMNYSLSEDVRAGDHQWYVSDVRKFQSHFPDWAYEYNCERIIHDMVAAALERQLK